MKKISTIVPAGIAFLSLLLLAFPAHARQSGDDLDYLDIPFTSITGEKTSLQAYQGNVILIVNVASKCGFTSQYEGLEALYREYGERGFTVIGFPANDFLGQEPGSNEEILQFCKENYDVTFPMMAKIHVKGDEMHPLYHYLTKESPEKGKITWNFNKFLLNREGEVVARFGSKTKPGSDEMVSKIEELLDGIGVNE
ncbi:glutathione peroxidase [bacterium]|nr:glutathione peroxidase [bacterium]